MQKKGVPKELLKEFEEFITADPVLPPKYITSSIFSLVRRELSPSPISVFLKIGVIVLLVGILNLTLCPQFGFGFARNSGLMEYFMQYGSAGCRIFCGAFFLGTGMLAATLILRPEDINVLRRKAFLQVSALAALFLIGFVAVGSEIYFHAALLWFVGSTLGGIVCLEFGMLLRKRGRKFLTQSRYHAY